MKTQLSFYFCDILYMLNTTQDRYNRKLTRKILNLPKLQNFSQIRVGFYYQMSGY